MSASPSPTFVRSVRIRAADSLSASQPASSSIMLAGDIMKPTPTAQESGIFLDSADIGDRDEEVSHEVSTGVLVGVTLGAIAGITIACVLGLYLYRRIQQRRRIERRKTSMSWLNLAPDETIKTTPFGRVQSPPPKRKSPASSLLSSRRSFIPKSSSQATGDKSTESRHTQLPEKHGRLNLGTKHRTKDWFPVEEQEPVPPKPAFLQKERQ